MHSSGVALAWWMYRCLVREQNWLRHCQVFDVDHETGISRRDFRQEFDGE